MVIAEEEEVVVIVVVIVVAAEEEEGDEKQQWGKRAMHFPYTYVSSNVNMLRIRYHFIANRESILCAMHVIYYVLYQSHDTRMLKTRISKKREKDKHWGRGGGQGGAERHKEEHREQR